MNALIAVVAFSLGVLCTLVGSFEYLNRANQWVIVSRDSLRGYEAYMRTLEGIINKHNWDEKHII